MLAWNQGHPVLFPLNLPYFLLSDLLPPGNPLPRVTWTKSGRLIDETYHILSNGTVRNEITFHNVDRSFLRTRLTCEASNTNLSRPISTTVDVDMNCKLLLSLLLWSLFSDARLDYFFRLVRGFFFVCVDCSDGLWGWCATKRTTVPFGLSTYGLWPEKNPSLLSLLWQKIAFQKSSLKDVADFM